jgi:hypothetical protein
MIFEVGDLKVTIPLDPRREKVYKASKREQN